MILYDQFLHILQQVLDGIDVWVGQLKDLAVGLGGNWVGQSRPLPGLLPFRQGSGSGTVLPHLGTSFLECMVRGGASSPACEIRSLFVAPSGGSNSPRAVKACLALLYPHHWGQFSKEGWQLFCWRGERGVGTVFWCPGSQSQLFLVKKYWENA